MSGRGREVFVRVRLEMGSSEITRGFGSAMGAMSITSLKVTLVSQLVVGDIVVGRVNVDVSM